MRIQAIRASETLYKAGDRSFAADYRRFARDTNPDVAIQAVLTLNRWKVPEANTAIKSALDGSKSKGVTFVANAILNPSTNAGRGGGGGGRGGGPTPTPEQQKVLDRGGEIYRELCFTCHGDDGLGTPRSSGTGTMGPSLAGSPRVTGHRDYVVKTLLHGLTGGVDGKTYAELMIPMGMNPDEWVAAISSYIRNSFGNSSGYVTPADVKRIRSDAGNRKTPWTVAELTSTLPARAASRRHLEDDGEPQRRECEERVQPDRLEHADAADAGHVVPGRVATARDDLRDRVRVHRWRTRRWRRRTRRTRRRTRRRRRACTRRAAAGSRGRGPGPASPAPGATKRRLSARLQGRGVVERDGVDTGRRGRRCRRDDDHHVQAGAREVHSPDADGHDRERAGVVDPATADLRGGEASGKIDKSSS